MMYGMLFAGGKMMNPLLMKRILRGSWVLSAIICMIIICYFTLPLIYPFLLAWLIAIMLNPTIQWMCKQLGLARWISVTICLTLFICSILTVATAMITCLIREIYHLSHSLDRFLTVWHTMFIHLFDNYRVRLFMDTISALYKDNPNLQGSINHNLSATAEKIATTATNFITSFVDSIVRLLSSLPNVATIAIIVLLSAFLISKDWSRWIEMFVRLTPSTFRKPVQTICGDLKQALFGYARAQCFLISITAFIIGIGLLTLRVEFAIMIGLFIGIIDLLPYVGAGAIMIPWLIYCLISGNTSLAIGLLILYMMVLIIRQIMEPKVLASAVGLDPLMTLIVMFVGMKLYGLAGIIVGPIVMILLSVMKRAHIFQDLRTYILYGRNG